MKHDFTVTSKGKRRKPRKYYKGFYIDIIKSRASVFRLELFRFRKSPKSVCLIDLIQVNDDHIMIGNVKSYVIRRGLLRALFTFFIQEFGDRMITLNVSPIPYRDLYPRNNREQHKDLEYTKRAHIKFYSEFGFVEVKGGCDMMRLPKKTQEQEENGKNTVLQVKSL